MVCLCCRNFLTLQQSPGTKQWQEKPLCLGNGGSCRGYFSGHILGFGEDELGTVQTFSIKFPSHSFAWRFCSARKLLCWKCHLEQRWPPGEISDGPVISWVLSITFLRGAVTSDFHSRNMKVTKAGKWEAGTKGELLSPEEREILNVYGYFGCIWVICLDFLSENLPIYPCLLE